MKNSAIRLRKKIATLLNYWDETGLPSRAGYEDAAADLLEWKRSEDVTGIWKHPLCMITSTLDDGLGQGLELIHLFSEIAGLKIRSLGLCRPPEIIIEECIKHRPEFLGLTVLQFDSEEDLSRICRDIPAYTNVISGGPIFSGDPDLSERAGIQFVAKNAAAFLRFVLDFKYIRQDIA